MSWKGSCNSCGVCCTLDKIIPETNRVIRFMCTNLLVADKIGRPGATTCAVWASKYDDMPIVMRSGNLQYNSKCLASYPRPQDAVPPECSYEFVPDELVKIRPAWEIGYLPELKENT